MSSPEKPQDKAMRSAREHAMAGNWPAAALLYREVLRLNPGAGDAHYNLGYVLRRAGDFAAAEESYRSALRLLPGSAEVHNGLGDLLQQLGRHDEAEHVLRRAIALSPGLAEAHGNLGIALQHSGRPDEALASFRRALALRPDAVEPNSNLGSALLQARQLAQAEHYLREAIRIEPRFPGAHFNLGLVLQNLGRFGQAESAFRQALSLQPLFAAAHQQLALLLLARGAFAEGFREYEWRLAATFGYDYLPDPGNPARTLPRPSAILPADWRDKRVLLLSDQGIGDEIFFLRFAPALAAAGAHLVHRPAKKALALLRRARWTAEVVAETERVDFHLAFAVSDLAQLAGSGNQTPPSLRLDPLPDRVAKIRPRLEQFGPPPWIGVAWSAGTGAKVTDYASLLKKEIDAGLLGASLAGIDARVVVLQRNLATDDMRRFQQSLGRPALDLTDVNDDLEDACAALSLLHDYVGVSSTNVHLQAALGKTARILVPWPGEWRWMAEGDSSPWFPGSRVCRQGQNLAWDAALQQVIAGLRATLPHRR